MLNISQRFGKRFPFEGKKESEEINSTLNEKEKPVKADQNTEEPSSNKRDEMWLLMEKW